MSWIEPMRETPCTGCGEKAPDVKTWNLAFGPLLWFAYKDGRWACSQGRIYKIARGKKS